MRKLSIEQTKLQRREKLLDSVVEERTKELEESYQKLKAANRQALFGLAEAIEAKDPYTKGHCGRVAAYSLVLAQECRLSRPTASRRSSSARSSTTSARSASATPCCSSRARSTRTSGATCASHPVKGCEIASKIEMLKPIMPAVRNHHERWDGTGYPDRMKAEDIPLPARIVAIADAYDAMATDRPYKQALPLEECEALLRKNAGKMYDPELVEVFCSQPPRRALPRGLRAATTSPAAAEPVADGRGRAPRSTRRPPTPPSSAVGSSPTPDSSVAARPASRGACSAVVEQGQRDRQRLLGARSRWSRPP